jgi:uncharacterized RDD family membrane protein YckC
MKCDVCGRDNPPEARFCANCGAALTAAPVQAPAPATPPAAPAAPGEYAGFWIRLGAAVIDYLILTVVSFLIAFPMRFAAFGSLSFLPGFGFPLYWVYHWLFIGLIGQTPGKMAVGVRVVNAGGAKPGLGIAALREILGKFISFCIILLGFIWIAFDGKKQGWHDRIAGTYVVRVVRT